MVTEAGKELLRNSINTATFHNKILEENEMWKQWETERGLTMMVSDDDILKRIRKHHQCDRHRRLEKESSERNRQDRISAASSRDKWDHSGFLELYPDEGTKKSQLPRSTGTQKSSSREFGKDLKRSPRKSSLLKSNSDRWDHGGYRELYPEDSKNSPSSHKKSLSDRWDHSGFRELYPDSDHSSKESLPKDKKKKKKRQKKSKGSSSDHEIHEEFKRYKKGQGSRQIGPALPSSSGFDNHINEWKKFLDKK